MSFENNWFQVEWIKNKILDDDEINKEKQRQLELKKQKEKLWLEIEIEHDLFQLKDLIEMWLISHETAKKIINGKEISNIEIKEIFDKIEEIEAISNIDNYLAKEYRVTKEEYLKAVSDNIYREEILTKIETSLMILSRQIIPNWASSINMFSWFIWILDKNLILIQENTIDLKKWLKELNKNSDIISIEENGLLKKFIKFIKKLFK